MKKATFDLRKFVAPEFIVVSISENLPGGMQRTCAPTMSLSSSNLQELTQEPAQIPGDSPGTSVSSTPATKPTQSPGLSVTLCCIGLVIACGLKVAYRKEAKGSNHIFTRCRHTCTRDYDRHYQSDEPNKAKVSMIELPDT